MTVRPCRSWTMILVIPGLVLASLNPVEAQVRPRPGSSARPGQLERPARPPDAAAMLAAYRESLRHPTVQRATRVALQQQLRTNRPIALVDGYLVTPVDLRSIYRDRSVQAAIRGALPGANPEALATDVGAQVGLAFTPMDFADVVMGDMAQDLTASIARNAFLDNRTDEAITLTAILVAFGVGVASGITGNAIWGWWTRVETPVDPNTDLPINHPQADPDGDGQTNASDHDDDNDGAPDSEDQHPHDPNKTMCPPELCGHRAVIALETGITDQALGAVLQAFGTVTAPGQTASLAAFGALPAFKLVFPTTGLR